MSSKEKLLEQKTRMIEICASLRNCICDSSSMMGEAYQQWMLVRANLERICDEFIPVMDEIENIAETLDNAE